MKNTYFFLILSILLSSCGGGGGGGSSTPQLTTQTFSGANDDVTLNVDSGGALTSWNAINVSNLKITTTGKSSDGTLNYVKFDSTDTGSQTFSKSSGHTFLTQQVGSVNFIGLENPNDGTHALIVNQNYSAFGFWNKKNFTGNYTAYAGHVGQSTTRNPSSIVGSATYTGGATGYYAGIGYTPVITAADFQANANFTNGTMTISTSSTEGFNSTTGASLGSYSSLDITGSLTKSANFNDLYIGNISNSVGHTGTTGIYIYGPNAEELAESAYVQNGSDTLRHIMSFGGSR